MMARPKRFATSYKLLVASVGVASITYSSCKNGPVANLVACPQDQCGGAAGAGSSSSGGTGGSTTGTTTSTTGTTTTTTK
jgi:hypothetical protein